MSIENIANSGNIETTGRYLVLLSADKHVEDKYQAGLSALRDATGFASIANLTNASPSIDTLDADIIMMDKIGIALTTLDPEQIKSLASAVDDPRNPMISFEPEVVGHLAINPAPNYLSDNASPAYLRGYRDAVDHLISSLLPQELVSSQLSQLSTNETWGLQVTGVATSSYSGKGVKVAVLDSGIDFTHPDFSGRTIVHQSFVRPRTGAPLLPTQDINGHGTHCAGTACGTKTPGAMPRYGIAYESELYIGRVANDVGRLLNGEVYAGLNWAIGQGCQIVSMSFEWPGRIFSSQFELIAQNAMASGCLLIAAGGNLSDRRVTNIVPVSNPAACPSIMAVGALDQFLNVAYFSPQSIILPGGQVDLVAPGVDVYSSWRGSTRYLFNTGTSMSAPHVAGIAALYAQAKPGSTPAQLWQLLVSNAKRLSLLSVDVGAGLVYAPQ